MLRNESYFGWKSDLLSQKDRLITAVLNNVIIKS